MNKRIYLVSTIFYLIFLIILTACIDGEDIASLPQDSEDVLTPEPLSETDVESNQMTLTIEPEDTQQTIPTQAIEDGSYLVPDLEKILAREPLPGTTVSGNQVTFTIEPQYTLQTIRTTAGGNFINIYTHSYDPVEPVSLYNLNHLDVNVARIRMTLEEFEIKNDNDDPEEMDFAGFKNDGYNEATFKLMQELQSRGIEIVASFWDVPDWLLSNPKEERGRIVYFDQYNELAECITAWLVMARDVYGVEVAYVSVNEPAIGSLVKFTEWELTTLILKSKTHFKKNNLNTLWLLADTSDTTSSALYASAMLINGDIADLTGPFAFHSWDADVTDEGYTIARDFAWAIERPVWCTEAGHRWWAYEDPTFFPTWENAIGLARTYSRVLKMSGAEVLLYWEMMGHDFWLNDGEEPFYSFETVRLFNDYFPKGTVIVDSSANTEEQFVVAGQAPEFFSVHLVNIARETQTIVLEGLPDGIYKFITFTEADWVQTLGMVATSDGTLTVEVAPASISILVNQ